MMGPGFFTALANDTFINFLAWGIALLAVLGLWKAVEIGVWCFNHIAISVQP